MKKSRFNDSQVMATAQGKLLASLMASLIEFERDLLKERVRSVLALAKARGKVLGRKPGGRPKSDKLTPRVAALLSEGFSYRHIANAVKVSKNTLIWILPPPVTALSLELDTHRKWRG